MEWDKKTAILAIFILFGSSSGILNLITPEFRKDAFTRSDFQEEIAQVIQADDEKMDVMREKIAKLEQRYIECNRVLTKTSEELNQHRHEAPPRWVIERIDRIQDEVKELKGR